MPAQFGKCLGKALLRNPGPQESRPQEKSWEHRHGVIFLHPDDEHTRYSPGLMAGSWGQDPHNERRGWRQHRQAA